MQPSDKTTKKRDTKNMEEKWLWYSFAAEQNPAEALKLYKQSEDINALYSFTEDEYRAMGAGDEMFIKALCSKDLTRAKMEKLYCTANNTKLLTLKNSEYPYLLKNIYDPPYILYTRGTHFNPCNELYIAIVGTRRASKYGIDTAYKIAYELALAGITIITGIADGIDSAAIRGCLDAGGKCVSVLARGVNVVYPASNKELLLRIMNNGCAVTEFSLSKQYKHTDFIQRNRIISGLCSDVVVVEAPENSGALITASHALEQDRDVFVVPGNINEPNYSGGNMLLKNYAKLITSVEDIIEEYEPIYPHLIQRKPFTAFNIEFEFLKEIKENRAMERIIQLLGEGIKTPYELAVKSECSIARTNGMLTVLSSVNAVEKLPGGRYRKNPNFSLK